MGWESPAAKGQQQCLFNALSAEEESLVRIILENGEIGIDALCLASDLSLGKISACLLNLELNNVITILPGKRYCIGRQPKK
jgi:DNA processing protein